MGNIKNTPFSKIGDDSNGCEKINNLSQKTVFFCAYPIKNGEMLEIEITDENVKSVFAITMDGILSNEILLEPESDHYKVLVTTDGGWTVLPYPVLIVESDKDVL